MNQNNLRLFAGILSLLIFIGFLGETGPKDFFGFSISIWVYRIAWLFLTIFFFMNYFKMRKAGK